MSKRESHKERLLEGAIACLQERGYARTTARDIVAAADSNLGAIGYHYGTKDELLAKALDEALRRWLKPLLAVGGDSRAATSRQRLRIVLNNLFGSIGENRPITVAFFEALAQAERLEQLREQMAESYRRLRAAIAARIAEDRAAPTAEDRALALAAVALLDGYLIQWMLDPDVQPPAAETIDAFIELTVANEPSSQTSK